MSFISVPKNVSLTLWRLSVWGHETGREGHTGLSEGCPTRTYIHTYILTKLKAWMTALLHITVTPNQWELSQVNHSYWTRVAHWIKKLSPGNFGPKHVYLRYVRIKCFLNMFNLLYVSWRAGVTTMIRLFWPMYESWTRQQLRQHPRLSLSSSTFSPSSRN